MAEDEGRTKEILVSNLVKAPAPPPAPPPSPAPAPPPSHLVQWAGQLGISEHVHQALLLLLCIRPQPQVVGLHQALHLHRLWLLAWHCCHCCLASDEAKQQTKAILDCFLYLYYLNLCFIV